MVGAANNASWANRTVKGPIQHAEPGSGPIQLSLGKRSSQDANSGWCKCVGTGANHAGQGI
ncbi:hypothetical protein PVK06_020950 [Gossypium arboreum]|uniref:Uncharacterized protein n=1 Tax=Gossypium arboreum TaxID=29729 RepID=A0ABR0PP56_GOSAR|nr:hypothetical protein PVK06_020950 [Gossypium arboreum]